MLLHFAKTNAISSDQLSQRLREEEVSAERGSTLFRGV
jgi:hypothetical protein